MSSKYDILIKDTAIFALGKFGSKLILFLLVPLYTNILTTEEYGIAELVLTLSQIIIPILSLMIFDGIMRFGLSKGENKEDVLLIGFIIIGLDCIFGLVVVALSGLYAPISKWRWYLYWNIILYIAYNVELNYMKAKDHNLMFSIVSIFQTFVIAIANILFLVEFDMGVKGYLIAANISYLAAFIFCFFSEKIWCGLKQSHFRKNLFVDMIKFSAPLALNNISWWVIQSADKFMVEALLNASSLGLYTLASKIPSLMNVFISIFQQSWGISSIREVESSNDSHFYNAVLTTYYIGVFSICILLNSIMKPFMRIYVGSAFLDAWIYVPLLLVSAAFSAIAVYYGGIYNAVKKSLNSMNTMIIAALVNIVLNFILIKALGVAGAATSTLISYVLLVVLRIVDIQKYVNISIDWVRFITNSVIIIAQAILLTIDYHVYIISAAACVAFIVVNMRELRKVIIVTVGKIKRK